jgi:hypothetical protein
LPDSRLLAERALGAPPRVFPAQAGPPLPPRDIGTLNDGWWDEPSVLDPGTDSEGARRVQFVCEKDTYRVGFWLDARDLRPTNRSETLLVARPRLPRDANDQLPGVRIPAGSAIVRPLLRSGAATPAVFDDEDLMYAEGYIASAVVDVVYEPTKKLPETIVFDGYLIGTAVDVRDAPRGALLAHLSLQEPLAVTQLRRRGDALLVRARGFDATVVGWVDSARFEPRPQWTEHWPNKGGSGGVGRHLRPRIELEVGTLLVHEDSGHTLGVVTQAAPFLCDGSCDALEPRVRVPCGFELRLRAVHPDCAQ